MTLNPPSRLKLGRVVDPIKIHILSEIENQEFLQNFMTLDVAKNCKMKKKYAGIMRLYPKINRRAKFGSLCRPGCRMTRSYSVSGMKFGHSSLPCHGKDVSNSDVKNVGYASKRFE